MKKLLLVLVLGVTLALPTTVLGAAGDLGFFGGISEGTRLPRTTERLLAQNGNNRRNGNGSTILPYKEFVFLTGTPHEFEGTIQRRTNGSVGENTEMGSFTDRFTNASNDMTGDTTVARDIIFQVTYRRQGNQIIKNYEAAAWTETINVEGRTFTLVRDQSHFNLSILEDRAPGVTYYSGNISMRAVFLDGAGDMTTLEMSGTIHGYRSAWSTAETHRLNYSIFTDEWQMQFQVRPSVSVNKELQYSQNEPTAISFSGNYMEVTQNQSGLQYTIFVQPLRFHDVPTTGGSTLRTNNTFEQLMATNMNHLVGHPAYSDIKQLFSMGILDGDTRHFVPNQLVTRGQFITMVVRAVRIPIQPPQPVRNARNVVQRIVFPDISRDRPDYAYIMASHSAGLAVGRENGHFAADAPISRQEMIVYLMRVLGLVNIAPDPTPMTPFLDDAQVASWARREIYAANRIGLIRADENGNINPQLEVSNAEAVAMVNRLINYMRHDLRIDFTENIVNFAN